MRPRLPFSLLVLLGVFLGACTTEDRCVERPQSLDFDEPGPWGEPAAEVYAHVEGQRSGTVTWLGGGEFGELSPGSGSGAVTITTHLHTDSAVGIQSEHVGDGRLACIDSMQARASVTIHSTDGALAEQLEVDVVILPGSVGDQADASVQLAPEQLGGTMSWTPNSSAGALSLHITWTDDAPQTVRAWLSWSEIGGEMGGGHSGSGRVLAEIEASVEP